MDSHADVEYTIRASYLEVYNEKVCVLSHIKSTYFEVDKFDRQNFQNYD